MRSDGINSDVESTMGLVEPTASSIKPDYGITNVTTQIGTSAYLPCKVKQIFNKSVSWVRVRDHHILTVDRTTFIADERFHAYYSSTGQLPGVWTLQIKYVQARDAGIYECHLNFYGDEQKTSARVQLNVVVPRTELIGDSNRYVKEGSKVTLHCIVSGALDPPLYIFWFHGSEQIYPDNRRSWKTDINRNSLESDHTQSTIGSLTIPSVKKKDSGNYTCQPSNSESINIILHVIN
ncbi:Zwei Ig domain protein zig-8, partial [Pseudolycoriella hygida]